MKLIQREENHKPIFEILLENPNHNIRVAFVHLLNMIASDSLGRSYLTENGAVIQKLIEILQSEEGDTNLRKRCLGTLQNLSLRKEPQNQMIEGNLIEACFKILKNENDKLSGFSLDYFTALLMNLCLRRNGKQRCEQNPKEILGVLQNLLYYDSVQVRTFVNGILFSILTRKPIKEAAAEINLLENLKELQKDLDERFQRQIDFIIEQTGNTSQPENPDQQSFEEEEEDLDNFGQDDEAIDDVLSEPEPTGGRLYC